MGEGGGFPAATRAVAEWFPTKDRATAMGIINAGTAVGAVIAPPLIALVLGYAGWRWIFVITGGSRIAVDFVVDLILFFAGKSSRAERQRFRFREFHSQPSLD